MIRVSYRLISRWWFIFELLFRSNNHLHLKKKCKCWVLLRKQQSSMVPKQLMSSRWYFCKRSDILWVRICNAALCSSFVFGWIKFPLMVLMVFLPDKYFVFITTPTSSADVPCPCALKPNRCSTMLDRKLEALPTRIYWLLPSSVVPSFSAAQPHLFSHGSNFICEVCTSKLSFLPLTLSHPRSFGFLYAKYMRTFLVKHRWIPQVLGEKARFTVNLPSLGKKDYLDLVVTFSFYCKI